LISAFTPVRGQDAVIDELLGHRCEGLVVVVRSCTGATSSRSSRGGAGALLRAVRERAPHADLTLFDRPEVVAVAGDSGLRTL